MKVRFLLPLIFCIAAFGQQTPVSYSAAPYSGVSATVTVPASAGDRLAIFTSAFVGADATVSFTDGGTTSQLYRQASNYSTAVTGSGVWFTVDSVTSDFISQPITATWTGSGDIAPAVIVFDLGPTRGQSHFQAENTGTFVTSLSSGSMSVIRHPAVILNCVGAGLTVVDDWQADTANGWTFYTNSVTPQAACEVLQITAPYLNSTSILWNIGIPVAHAYSAEIAFYY
jgi:hypothetical protein